MYLLRANLVLTGLRLSRLGVLASEPRFVFCHLRPQTTMSAFFTQVLGIEAFIFMRQTLYE